MRERLGGPRFCGQQVQLGRRLLGLRDYPFPVGRKCDRCSLAQKHCRGAVSFSKVHGVAKPAGFSVGQAAASTFFVKQ